MTEGELLGSSSRTSHKVCNDPKYLQLKRDGDTHVLMEEVGLA